MNNRSMLDGLVVLTLGLAASSASSLLGHIGVLGSATDLARGFLDGLSVVMFCVAIFVLVRSRQAARGQ
jgi:hypothetical protein